MQKVQIVLSTGLRVLFMGFTHLARNIEPFVKDNWTGCEYPKFCPKWLVGSWAPGGTSSLRSYAEELNLSQNDLVEVLTPIAYGCATAALMTVRDRGDRASISSSCLFISPLETENVARILEFYFKSACSGAVFHALKQAGVISGGSNLAKFMYYKNIMSRKEELAALRNGGAANMEAMRKDALVKRVRRQRAHDITVVAASMSQMAIVDLEEKALMMEFATAVAMERHYDLQVGSLLLRFNVCRS